MREPEELDVALARTHYRARSMKGRPTREWCDVEARALEAGERLYKGRPPLSTDVERVDCPACLEALRQYLRAG